ncbi:uncharacterized protein [Panulirus ornatus]|uniref:uncharacterized protein isoform X2 n=1 Tax=Panulirus ornatus TaxID=150431 RepID=UPI003A85D2A6
MESGFNEGLVGVIFTLCTADGEVGSIVLHYEESLTMTSTDPDIIPENGRREIMALSKLTNDDFLTTWDTCLKFLTKKRKQGGKSHSYYIVQESKDEAELQAEMLCHVLELVIQQTITDEELASVLISTGLQRDRVNLIVSQRNQLQEVISRKLHDNPREQLVDLQWKFGVVAGSSLEGEAGKTFVQVKLVCRSLHGTHTSSL